MTRCSAVQLRQSKSGEIQASFTYFNAAAVLFAKHQFKAYLVFYRPAADGIEVIRVLHGARDIHSILADEFGIAGDAEPDDITNQ